MNDKEQWIEYRNRISMGMGLQGEQTKWVFDKALQGIDEVKRLKEENNKLKAFYDYFSELYGQGLEIANWHQNGELEPFDDFFDSAEKEMD
ncbi:MAG TPA: hypothetical protein VFH42_00230 [Sporolactobacillaceae bacterium]|nr:hypothetical protein [Sporolactobacillaceae bacterium]